MRLALAIAATVLLASPAVAKPLYCVLWPREAACLPIPPPAPPPAARPVTQDLPKAVAPAAAPPKPAKRIPESRKAKAVPPVKRVAEWCAQVPAWATLDQIKFAAAARGHTMTAAQIAQAQACLASKRSK